jgi:hypothetical protein
MNTRKDWEDRETGLKLWGLIIIHPKWCPGRGLNKIEVVSFDCRT